MLQELIRISEARNLTLITSLVILAHVEVRDSQTILACNFSSLYSDSISEGLFYFQTKCVLEFHVADVVANELAAVELHSCWASCS